MCKAVTTQQGTKKRSRARKSFTEVAKIHQPKQNIAEIQGRRETDRFIQRRNEETTSTRFYVHPASRARPETNEIEKVYEIGKGSRQSKKKAHLKQKQHEPHGQEHKQQQHAPLCSAD